MDGEFANTTLDHTTLDPTTLDIVALDALPLDAVRARLNYLVPMAEKPFSYQYDPPPGRPQRSGQYAERVVTIADARKLPIAPALDREGFALRGAPSAVRDFYDDAQIKQVYYPEVERLVAEASGARRVIAFDHNRRNAKKARAGEPGFKEPVPRIHNDYTEKSGPQRARDLLGADDPDLLNGRRIAIINLWRPIVGPVEDWPLALADARSIAPGDLVPTDLIYPNRVGETYALTHRPQHRWFYFPRMQRDEALFIKCFDSHPWHARFSAHTAFQDPTAPANAAPRESIEVRTLAIF